MSVAQRLARRLCRCKRRQNITDEHRRLFAQNNVDIPPDHKIIYVPTGCSECGNTGYRGRFVSMEIHVMTDNFRAALIDGRPFNVLRDVAIQEGFRPLFSRGLDRVLEGITSLEECHSVLRT